MMFGHGSGWAWWQVLVMWVGIVGFWALIVWAVYALDSSVTRRPDHEPRADRDDGPRRILDERLANGDIDTEEYRRLRDLSGAGDPTLVGAGDKR
ncbi:MAG: SHOCT domain-containing protein [Acidimicrobiales bacterium]|nr:SHOCT domain-containing protein [Acidimicrobiales bacterium]